MRRYILILIVPLDSFNKICFLVILVKVLSLAYTTSCRFSLKFVDFQANWIWRGCRRRNAFRHFSKQNPSHSRSEFFDCNSIFHEKTLRLSVLQYSMKRLSAWAYFNFEKGFRCQEHWISSQDLAAPQSNLSFLETKHSGETATDNVKLGQHFY